MSTFWTPSGERPIPRDDPGGRGPAGPSGPAGGGGGGRGGAGGGVAGDEDELTEAELEAELRAVQEQMLRTPAVVVIANHCIGLIELAALHLGQSPPHLAEAQVAIDALAGVLDALGPRLGPNEAPLRQALNQMRMAYIEAKTTGNAFGGPEPGPED